MTAAALAIVFEFHPSRLRSPLGVGLVIAMVVLVAALFYARRRRLRCTASARTARTTARGRASLARQQGEAHSRLSRLTRTFARKPHDDLASLLAPYNLSPNRPRPASDDSTWALVTIPQLKRLSLALESLASRTGLGPRLNAALERAGVRVRQGELLTLWLIALVIALGFGFALAGSVGAILVGVLGLISPPAALQAMADRRAKLFATQLPDVLKLTASSLRAGFSLLQGLEAVTKQLQEPSAGELQRVLNEARLGRPIEDALEAAATRIGNRDFSESMAAVRIQQEAGGNLASLFDTLAETMFQRLRLRREIRTLTAEGRLSAYVLGALPVIIAAFLFASDRHYMLVLFHTEAGKIALVGSLLLQLAGFFWMYRTVKIEA
jgi:Flp pilus assembly protein TadB